MNKTDKKNIGCFIKTNDKDTADKLMKQGFHLIDVDSSNTWFTFLNENRTVFEDNSHCFY